MLKNVWCLIVFVSFCFVNNNTTANSISYKVVSPHKNGIPILLCGKVKIARATENDQENRAPKKVQQQPLKGKDVGQENLLKVFSQSPLKKADKENRTPTKATNSPSRKTSKKSDKENVTPQKTKGDLLGKDSVRERKTKERQNADSLALSRSPLKITPEKASSRKEDGEGNDKIVNFPKDPNLSPLRPTVQKISIFSPLKKCSPISAERKYFSPIRREFFDMREDGFVSSPKVRTMYRKLDTGNYWSRRVRVKGKTVYQADFLFDPYAKVLTNGRWITNLERMENGLCPIAHKGIVSKTERKMLTSREIESKQRQYRIELHHAMQKDTGTDDAPLFEMTQEAHMGKNGRMITAFNSKTGKREILYSSLEKKEAMELCDEDQPTESILSCFQIETNLLHFRLGPSLIDRDGDYNPWRTKYWQIRAKDIRDGTFVGKDNLPTHRIPTKLFQ